MDGIDKVDVRWVSHDITEQGFDHIIVESPFSLKVLTPSDSIISLGTTMRTPGDDANLTRGLLFAEGIIENLDEMYIEMIDSSQCIVRLNREIGEDAHIHQLLSTSSCGICGKETVSNLLAVNAPELEQFILDSFLISNILDTFTANQTLFEETGGSHACAAFRPNGNFIEIAEDIGRHNAMDKLVGKILHKSELYRPKVLVVSGRMSFEMVTKARRAGFSVILALGAASDLCIQIAREHGITLCGFVRKDRLTIYSHPSRITPSKSLIMEVAAND